MTKYTIRSKKPKYVLIEKATELTIAIADKARDLRDLKASLESGNGFDGNTPAFLVAEGPINV